MQTRVYAATAALFIASGLVAQDGSDPNAPIKAVAGQSTTSSTAAPAGIGVVLPNAFKAAMGNYNNIFGVAWANQRYHQQHTAAEVGNAKPFFGHSLRMRGASYTGPTQTLEIRLSISATTPATHSSTFATNVGTNPQKTVFKGVYKYPDMVPNTDPTSFKIPIPYAAPWPWTNPTGGALLMDTRNTSAANGSYFVDAANGVTYNLARSWANDVNATTAIGNAPSGLIIGFYDKPIVTTPTASYQTFGKGCRGSGGSPVVILPASSRTALGNSNNIFGVAYQDQRYHQLFTGSEVGSARVFSSHAFRPGARTDVGPQRTLKILMSRSQTAVPSISTTFATNIGTNVQTTVFSGTHTYPNMVPSTNPTEFKLVVPWTANYVWAPAAGDNMLYEYQCSDLASGGGYYPNAHSGDANVSRLWGTGPAAATGTIGANYGVCFAFGYKGSGNNVPTLGNAGRPVINTSFDVTLSGAQSTPGIALLIMGVSNTTWGTIPLPFDLTPLGAGGCNLLVSFDLIGGVVVNGSGTGKATYSIPNAPALYGLVWHNQYAVIDTGANQLGIAFSNGGTAKVGGM